MARLIMFCIFALIVLSAAIMSVMTKRIMRAATYLLFVLLGIAGLYFVMGYTYLGTAQISVYAGGITMLYIFAIRLVGKQSLQGLVENFKKSSMLSGILASLAGLATVLFVVFKNNVIDLCVTMNGDENKELPMQKIGEALLSTDVNGYILPFEFISVFLLACIIGGVMMARKEEVATNSDKEDK